MSICTLTSITLLVYNKTNAKTSLHFTLDLCFPLPSLFNIKKPPYIYTYMMTPLIKYTEKETILLSEEQICNCSVVPLSWQIACISANRPKPITELTCKFFWKKNVVRPLPSLVWKHFHSAFWGRTTLHLVTNHFILVPGPVIRTLLITTLHKPRHIIFIHIHGAVVSFVIFIIFIVSTKITTCRHNNLTFIFK